MEFYFSFLVATLDRCAIPCLLYAQEAALR